MNGPYVRRMIPEPGDADREVPVLKHIYAAVASVKTAQENLVTGVATNDERLFRMRSESRVFRMLEFRMVLIVVQEITTQNPNGMVMLLAARAEGNGLGIWNPLQTEEFDLMAAVADLDEIEEMDQLRLRKTMTLYDNEIFNMFTQEEQYTEILDPIPEPHQVQQNDNVILISRCCGKKTVGNSSSYTETVEENIVDAPIVWQCRRDLLLLDKHREVVSILECI
ncbi:hypothetical protein Tco_0538078 [Tanacetum coccineum]